MNRLIAFFTSRTRHPAAQEFPRQYDRTRPVAVFLACTIAMLSLPLWGLAAADEPVNLIANGDFTHMTNGQADSWRVEGDRNTVAQTLKVLKDASGSPYAELNCTRCDHRTPSSHAMLAQYGQIRLEKGKFYEFSCRVKTEKLAGRSIGVAIQDTKEWANCGLEGQISTTAAWTTVRRPFQATRDVSAAGRLQIWYTEPGVLDLANVRIVACPAQEVVLTDVVARGTGRNLLPNGSFEVGPSGWSSMGGGVGWGNLDCLHGTVQAEGGSHGKAFLRVPVGGEHTPVIYFDYFEAAVRREFSPLAVSRGWIPVTPGSAYTISCDMRASVDGTPAVLGVRAKDAAGHWADHKKPVKLTTAWAKYTFTFKPRLPYVYVLAGPDLKQEQRVDVDIVAVQLEEDADATPYSSRDAVEIGLEPGQDGGIFTAGQAAGLVLQAHNFTDSPAKAEVRFEVTDYDDRPVSLPVVSLDVPGGASVRKDIALPDDWRGYYRLRAYLAGAKEPRANLRLAIVPPRSSKETVCGFNHAFPSARLIHLAEKAGVSMYRDWSLKWQHLEPKPGEFHWDVGDAQIDRVLREGPALVALMPPFPSADWSSEAPPGLPTTGYPGIRLRQAWGPTDPNDLAAFIGQAVRHYKDRVRVWDFLNEPIYTDYSLPSSGKYGGRRYTAADYVHLLAVASAAIRKADPDGKIIGGIGSGPGYLTKDVIDAGILKLIDIFNLHIYPGARMPESYAPEMVELMSRMDAAGGRKPVWVTEFSYYGSDDLPRRPFIPGPHAWAEPRLLDSERRCADYTVRFFAVMLSHGAEKVFIHAGDSGKVNEQDFECMMFDYGGAPRRMFPALAVFTEVLGPSPKFAGEAAIGEAGHCLAFESAGRSVLMMWAEEGSAPSITGPSGSGLAWQDAMGRKLAGPPAALSSSITYLTGPAGSAKTLLQGVKP